MNEDSIIHFLLIATTMYGIMCFVFGWWLSNQVKGAKSK